MTAQLRLTLLGEATATIGGEPLQDLRSRKALALLYYLAITGKTHTRSSLAGLLWPDIPEANARMNLRKEISRLRQVVGPFLKISRDTVAFNRSADYWLDVEAFETLARSRSETAKLTEAAAHYQGDFLDHFHVRQAPLFDNWVLSRRATLRELALQVLYELGVLHWNRGELQEAIDYTRRLLDLEPWREETQRQLMKLLALNGRRSEALIQYETCRRVLADELGIDPAAETTTLYEQIVAGELEASEPLFEVTETSPVPSFLEEHAGPDEIQRPLFVAREGELDRMHECLQEAVDGRGQLLFIAGRAGAGKSALAEAFSRQAQEKHPELLVVMGAGTAHTGIGDPYLPFRNILAMLTGDVEQPWLTGQISRRHAIRLWEAIPNALQTLVLQGPDLVNHFLPGEALLARAEQATGGNASWLSRLKSLAIPKKKDSGDLERGHFHDQYLAVLQALAAKRPLLIVLDDLQWADTASLNLLFHLGSNLAGSRILLVAAYRPDEVAAGRFSQITDGRVQHPLQKVLDEFRRRFGDTWLNLDDNGEGRGEAFVNAFLDTEPNTLDPEFREKLQEHTGGHPLFTVELLKAMQEQGGLIQDSVGCWKEGPALDWRTMPARIEGVIEEHIRRLDDDLRQTLSIASVEGEDFTAQVVAQVREADVHGLVHQLSYELGKKHRLIIERGSRQAGDRRLYRYRFRHNLFQLHLYNALGEFERELLHRTVGNALETLYEGRTEEIAGRLAWHFSEARDGEKAVKYLLRAGDQARELYAYDEAIDHYERALVPLKQEGDHELAARTLMKLGLTYHQAFAFRRARRAYDEGFALWQRVDQIRPIGSLPRAPHALQVDWYKGVRTLDSAIGTLRYSVRVIDQLFSGLLEYTSQMELVPNLARSWKVQDSGQKYYFYLRDDIRWSDGVPVAAGDFVYAWKRVLAPATGSLNSSLLYCIKGARAYHQGELLDSDQLGIHALDDTTLEVELEKPSSYFPYILANTVTYAVPRHVLEAEGETWTTADKIITNGPFKLENWIPGESLILVRNFDSPVQFTGNVEQVSLSLVTDPAARLEMYASGDLDVLQLHGFPREKLRQALRQHANEYLNEPHMFTMFLAFNVNKPRLANRWVRQALVQAIDRKALAEVEMVGFEYPATGGFVPPGMPGHSPDIGLPHDVNMARQLLDDAGFPGGAGFPTIDLFAHTGFEPVCEYLQESWWESLGVEITWETLNIAQWVDGIGAEAPALSIYAYTPEYPDPDNFLRAFFRTGFWHGWRNEEYEALLEKANRVRNQNKRMIYYMEADKILMKEAVIIPLTYGRRHMLVKPWVRRFPTSALKANFWKDTVIEAH